VRPRGRSVPSAVADGRAPGTLASNGALEGGGRDELRLLSSAYTGGDIAFSKRVTITGVRGERPTLDVGSLRLLAPGSRLEGVTVDGKPRSLGSAPDMGASEWVPTAPRVTTGEVSAVSSSAAIVPGSVDARGAATTFSVEYGVSGYSADLKKSIKVSKLPRGAYTLQVRVKTKDGRTVKSSKRYRTCSGH
jgi:hypothetical protein